VVFRFVVEIFSSSSLTCLVLLISDLGTFYFLTQLLNIDGQNVLREVSYASAGPSTLIEYTPQGLWKILDCYFFPLPDDVFAGKAPIACRSLSRGIESPPVCSERATEFTCLSHPSCGWCRSTRRCSIGSMNGICSSDAENCPTAEWRFAGGAVEEKGIYSAC
jgi:hypothetical protein